MSGREREHGKANQSSNGSSVCAQNRGVGAGHLVRGVPGGQSRVSAMIRILVAAEVRLYRDGLAEVLGGVKHFHVEGTARDVAETVEQADALQPDVILLDLAMPEAIAAIRSIVGVAPDSKVVGLAAPQTETELIACAEAAISGYVERDGSLSDLEAAVEAAGRGEVHCSPRIAAALARRVAVLAVGGETPDLENRLTSRERQIVELLNEGLSNKEIAQRLCIEVPTVKHHVHHVLAKLGVNRRVEVAAKVRNQRMRSPEPLLPEAEPL